MNQTKYALTVLERANPVPEARIPALAGRAAEIRPDWGSLPPVARNRPAGLRRAFLVAATVIVAAAAAIAVASAMGVRLPILDFGEAEKAPPKVVLNFTSLDVGAPAGMASGVVAGQTRRVATASLAGKQSTLYVAPTQAGGFCTFWTELGGGCDRLGAVPLSVSWGGASGPGKPRVSEYLFGHANAAWVDRVEIRFADGTVVQPTVRWVSKPIGAGFFLYDVPAEHQRAGREVEAVIGRDAEGRLVTVSYADPLAKQDLVPEEAIVEERRVAAKTQTDGGEAVIWEAPTRYEGRCAWLEYQGRRLQVGCVPKQYGFEGVALGFLATSTDAVVWGHVSPKTETAEVRFADGARVDVRPQNGFLLYGLPRERLAPERLEGQIALLDASGRSFTRLPLNAQALCWNASECPVGSPGG